MKRSEYEIKYLREGLENLKPFLLSDEIFWNVSLGSVAGFAPYPQLTLGNLLLSAKILKCLDAEMGVEELEKLEQEAQAWLTAWKKKAAKEFGYRLRQWARVVDDLSQTKGQGASLVTEVRNRVLLNLLRNEIPSEAEALGSAAAYDGRLKGLSDAGEFVWDKEIASCFDEQDYWFLYRTLKNYS